MLAGMTFTAFAEDGSKMLGQETPIESEKASAYKKGLEMIESTGDAKNITLPDASSYLSSPEVKYVNAGNKNSIYSYRKPWRNKSATGSYPYHGTKVLVVAKQDQYDCIVFKDNNNQTQAAWVHDEELTWYYPGAKQTIGVPCVNYADNTGDAEITWSEEPFEGSRQKYTILTDPVFNCVQFTLDYQVIGRGGAGINDILGDRIVYVSDGSEWKEVGRFSYDEIDAVHVIVNLEEPMKLAAVATIADCKKPDAFLFRQGVQDVLTTEAELTRYDSGEYSYTLHEDGTAEIISYHGTDSIVELPSVLDGHLVTAIGSEIFHDNILTYVVIPNLTEVIIPDSVTTIGDRAFEDCLFLETVHIPNSVTKIGNEAFSACGLETISIPDSVISIGDSAFSDCCELVSVTIPDSVQTIGINPFRYCEKLSKIDISDNHPYLKLIDGVLFSRADERLVCYPYASLPDSHYSIPQGTKIIGAYAFDACGELVSITIPDSVIIIGDNAFCTCTGLKNISLPDSVEFVGNNPFLHCHELAEIVVSKGNPYLRTIDGVLFSKTDNRLICFPEASPITDYSVPAGTRLIGVSAFEHCFNLNSISFPDSVIKIRERACNDCRLASITLPDSISEIESEAFSGSISLENITIPKGAKKIDDGAFSWCHMKQHVEIPDSVITMGDSVFHHCSGIETAYIPASVRRIGANPFGSCPHFRELTIAWNHPYLTLIDGVLFGKQDHRLICCPAAAEITEYSVPQGTRIIDAWAFDECIHLKKVIIPDSVTEIHTGAFSQCQNLESISIPKSITEIDYMAFYQCDNLILKVVEGSFAEQYCRANGLSFTYAT